MAMFYAPLPLTTFSFQDYLVRGVGFGCIISIIVCSLNVFNGLAFGMHHFSKCVVFDLSLFSKTVEFVFSSVPVLKCNSCFHLGEGSPKNWVLISLT